MKPQVVWACLLVIAGVTACSTATEQPFSRVPRRPALSDFASGDRETVSAMLRDVTGKFRSPFTLAPSSRAVTILLACRVQFIRAGVVGVKCLSAGPELDLAIEDCAEFYYQPDWAQKEFGVSAVALAVGDKRTCVVYGSGFGGNLWKRFLIFPGPAH
jgi:hypothetical protein